MASFLVIPLLSASNHPFTNNDDQKRTTQPIVGEVPQEANGDLSNTPLSWRLKRNLHNALFEQAVKGNLAKGQNPLPEMVAEDHRIVEWTELGFPLKGVYTLETPPKTEASLLQRLGSKVLTFLLNYLSLDADDLPVVPADHDTLMKIILPDAYAEILPRPRLPREISDNIDDVLAGTALSGPFANRIARAFYDDLRGTPFESHSLDGFFVIDLNEYSAFSINDKYERLGGKALLKYNPSRKKLETKSIFYEGVHYVPTDPFWPQLQKIMMATQTADIAMIRHLLHTHVIMAGLFSSVVYKAFSISHPLLEFLYPHIHGTIATNNYKLSILVSGQGSMFPSLFNFDEQGILNILQRNVDDFNIFKLDVRADLEERGMLPNEHSNIDYSYADITLKLWDLTRTYIESVVYTLYPTEGHIANDEQLLAFYNLLANYVPNNQFKQYVSELNQENLIRLLTLYIYNDSVEHYIVGTMTYRFQLNAREVPFSVRRDGVAPSIGEAQNAANLVFATQPTLTSTVIVDRASNGLTHTNIKLAMKNYQEALLQMQASVESSFRDLTTPFDFKVMQMGVNS